MPNKYKKIDGWFDEGFSRVYNTIVAEAKNGDWIVECGSWKGCSSVYLLEAIQESEKVLECYFFDTWTGNVFGQNTNIGDMYPEFLINLIDAGFEGKFNATVMDSIEASQTFNDNELFAIMLDDNHCTEYVSKEIDVWLPKIKPGGILAFHDYLDPNLRHLFNQKLNPIEDFESCGLYRKV